MAKSNSGRAGSVLRNKVKAAEDALNAARQEYKNSLDADPSRLDEPVFAQEWAKKIDAAQRNVTKFEQMLDMYPSDDEDLEEEDTTKGQRVKASLSRLKDTVIRSAKQGAASAVVKQVAEEAMLALGDNVPSVILCLPVEARNAALCAIVYMATEAYPGIPMSAEAGGVALLAFEATAAKTFASATEAITPKLAGMFKRLALNPAAAGAVVVLAANANKE